MKSHYQFTMSPITEGHFTLKLMQGLKKIRSVYYNIVHKMSVPLLLYHDYPPRYILKLLLLEASFSVKINPNIKYNQLSF